MSKFFVNGKPAPFIQSFSVTMGDGTVHRAVADSVIERVAHGAEILAEARMRERLRDDATWYALRSQLPSPELLEGK